MINKPVLLTAIVNHSDREKMIDLLMAETSLTGFTVTDGQGFSREHSQFSMGEQVVGYRPVARFEVLCQEQQTPELLELLRRVFPNGFRHWIYSLH